MKFRCMVKFYLDITNEFKSSLMSFFYFLEPLKEFVNLDNNLTDQLLSLQAKAVELGLLAQKFEDEGNAYYVLSQTGVRTIIFPLPQITAFLYHKIVLSF